MDIEVVRKWAATNYPFLIGNDDVIIMLYKKQVLGEEVIPKTKAAGFYRESSSLVLKENSLMLATIVSVDNTYIKEVCSVCKNKECQHNAPKERLYCVFGTAVDRAGKFGYKVFTIDPKMFEVIKDSNTLIITGFLDARENFGEDKLNVKNARKVSMEEAMNFIKAVDFIQMKGVQGRVKAAEWNNFITQFPESSREIVKTYLVMKEEGEDIYTAVQ